MSRMRVLVDIKTFQQNEQEYGNGNEYMEANVELSLSTGQKAYGNFESRSNLRREKVTTKDQ